MTQISSQNEKIILKEIYDRIKIFHKPKFKIGDYVRISKHKKIFDKGYHLNWTHEMFSIEKVNITNPVTYILKD